MAWIEDTGKRGRKVKHYTDSADPTRHQAVFTIHDQHYHDGVSWQDVDETILDDASLTGYTASARKMAHAVYFGAGGDRRWYPRLNVAGEYVEAGKPDYWTGTRWRAWNLTGLVRGGNVILWETADYRVTITVTWNRIKLDYTLKTANAPARIRFPLAPTGLTWANGDLIGGDGIVAGRLDAPTAIDANKNPLPVTGTYAGGYYEIACDLTGAVYPVTIDPTFTDGYQGDVNSAYDTYVQEDVPDTNYGTNESLCFWYTGAAGWRLVPLLKFTLTALAGATINSATLSLYQHAYGSNAYTATVHRLLSANSGWTEAGATWNYAVASTTRWAGDTDNNGGANAGCTVSGTDFNATGMGNVSGSGSNAEGTLVSVTLDTTQFAALVSANYGIMLKGLTGTNQYLCSSDHATTGYRPKLVVDYSAGPTLSGSQVGSVIHLSWV